MCRMNEGMLPVKLGLLIANSRYSTHGGLRKAVEGAEAVGCCQSWSQCEPVCTQDLNEALDVHGECYLG